MPKSRVISRPSPWIVAWSALAALAITQGIGRFAFTPILPMMQADHGVTLAQGGWLASANYIGYFLGSLLAARLEFTPRSAIRIGLGVIVSSTLAMALEQPFGAWVVWRALAGFASAWVMVHVSAWALHRLNRANRSDLGGVVYAGVGIGIALAGLTCLALATIDADSGSAWISLGVAALVLVALVRPVLGDDGEAGQVAGERDDAGGTAWRRCLVLSYFAAGLGYIIPATFLPVMAKQIMPDPAWFGWAWPIFGAAAALSTFVAARIARLVSNVTVWIAANLLMAAGVLVPLAVPTLTGIAIAAACVGGTFVVITMVGLEEARKAAGTNARALIGAMTTSWGLGQIVGPLLVSGLERVSNGFALALVGSAVPLVGASCALLIWRGGHSRR